MKKLVLVLCLTIAFVAGMLDARAQVDTIAPKWVHEGFRYAVLSPDGNTVVAQKHGKNFIDTFFVYSADDGKFLKKFPNTGISAYGVFSRDSKQFLYHSPCFINIMDIQTGENVKLDTKFIDTVFESIEFFLPTDNPDEFFTIYRIEQNKYYNCARISISQKKILNETQLMTGYPGYIWHSPDYRFVAFTITTSGSFPSDPTKYHSYIYSTDSLKRVWQSEEGCELFHVNFSNDSKYMAMSSYKDLGPSVYNLSDMKFIGHYTGGHPFFFSYSSKHFNLITKLNNRMWWNTYQIGEQAPFSASIITAPFIPKHNLYISDSKQIIVDLLYDNSVACYSFPVAGVSDETGKTAAISVYPTPTSSEIKIEWQAAIPYTCNLEVSNTEGKVVLSRKGINALPGINSFALNTSELAAGTYFLRIISGAETKATGKFMVGR